MVGYSLILVIYRILEYLILYGMALANSFSDSSALNGYKIILLIIGLFINFIYFSSMI